jgi:hypothetical protein
MKHIAFFVLGLALISNAGAARAQDAAVDTALLAAPANQRAAATIIKWKPDFTYETVKKGTSRLVCYDLSGWPQQQPFFAQCTSEANLARVAQNLKFAAAGDKAKTQALLDAAEKDGTRVKPEYGSVWYHLMGADTDHTRTQITIALPDATSQTTGLPDNNKQGGAWLMNAGTTAAHMMIPGA